MQMRLVVAACAALFSLCAHALTEVAGETAADAARVIVKFKAAAPVARTSELAARAGVALRAGNMISDRAQVVLGSGMSSAALAQRLAAQPDVEYAVPDRRRSRAAAPNDPLYLTAPGRGPASGQWYLRPNAGEVRSSIDVEAAWAVSSSPSPVVAVLDTGVRYEHPDLGANLLPGYDFVTDVLSSNDGDARDADASDPGDWLTPAEIDAANGYFAGCVPEPSSWHGTQVSGLVAAVTNNGEGMAGVARGGRVLPVRVLGKCGGFDSDIIAGMRWASGLTVPGVPRSAELATVQNLSLSGEGPCEAAYRDVLQELTAIGVVVVAAAGNDAGHAVGAPGNCPGVIAVGALRHVGQKVGFSNVGPELAISAPGGNCVNTTSDKPCLYPILTTTNSGTTVPVASTYTDSFNITLGTSFSAPLVAGTVALMHAVRSGATPSEIRTLLQATARPFPTSGGSTGDPVCTAPQFTPQGAPIEQLQCYCTTSTCGAGMLDAGTAVEAAARASLPREGFAMPYQGQGLWWNAPAGSESGWGLNVAHQGDVMFVTWFTYDAAGRPWWLSMTGTRLATNEYAGTLYETRGPPFSALPFDPARVTATAVGSATLVLESDDTARFTYTVNGVQQAKSLTRQVFGAVPACTFALHPPLSFATNYQDLWWASPAGSESGWGINLTMQGNVIFATWFTYDETGAPLWVSGTAREVAPTVYSGALNRTTGPAFSAMPWDPAAVRRTEVGSFSLQFLDGNAAQFGYTLNGVTQVKAITRQVFRLPGTACG